MKTSKEYSQKLRNLYISLKRKHPKVKKVAYESIIEALVYAIVSENRDEVETLSAIKKMNDHFVDYNDLRVSRVEEIAEVLGGGAGAAADTAMAITRALRAVFNQYNTVSLESLKKMGKRAARQILEKIDAATPFVVDYCVLTSLQGHAIPLTEKMVEYLKTNKMVHPSADRQQIEGFLTRQISAENAYEFYALLRYESEFAGTVPKQATAGRKKKRTTRSKKTKKRKTKRKPATA